MSRARNGFGPGDIARAAICIQGAVSSGVYLVRLAAGHRELNQKIQLVK